jgi:hypothetical protein
VKFQDVAVRVFSFCSDADYESALTTARDARATYPNEDNTLTFWGVPPRSTRPKSGGRRKALGRNRARGMVANREAH